MPETNPVKKHHRAETTQFFINHRITQPLPHHTSAPIGPWTRHHGETGLVPVFMSHPPAVLLRGQDHSGQCLIQRFCHQKKCPNLVSQSVSSVFALLSLRFSFCFTFHFPIFLFSQKVIFLPYLRESVLFPYHWESVLSPLSTSQCYGFKHCARPAVQCLWTRYYNPSFHLTQVWVVIIFIIIIIIIIGIFWKRTGLWC